MKGLEMQSTKGTLVRRSSSAPRTIKAGPHSRNRLGWLCNIDQPGRGAPDDEQRAPATAQPAQSGNRSRGPTRRHPRGERPSSVRAATQQSHRGAPGRRGASGRRAERPLGTPGPSITGRPGGAIAAGAAIGFVAAASAAAWAGAPPAPGSVLVLYRSKPDAGLLGRLSVAACVEALRHDAAEDRETARSTAVWGQSDR